MAVKLHSGLLKQRVEFFEPTTTVNDQGGKDKTYSVAISTRAYVTATDDFRAQMANATALVGTVRVFIRFRASALLIRKDWLIRYNGKDHVIHSIGSAEGEDKKTYLEFLAKSKE